MPLQDRFQMIFRNAFNHFFTWAESRLDRSIRDSKAIYRGDSMLSITAFIPGGLTRWITWGKLDILTTSLSFSGSEGFISLSSSSVSFQNVQPFPLTGPVSW